MAKPASGEGKAPLVIALVFFVLATIGLGVFAYTMQEDLDAAKKAATEANKGKESAEEVTKKAREETSIYKAAMGLTDPATDLNFQYPKEAKEVFTAMMAAIEARANAAIQDQVKQSAVAGGGFSGVPADVFDWGRPEAFDSKVVKPPTKPLIDSAVAAQAARELSERKNKDAMKTFNDKATEMGKISEGMKAAEKSFTEGTKAIPDKIAEEAKKYEKSYDSKKKEIEDSYIKSRESFDKASEKYGKTEIDLKKANDRIATLDRRLSDLLDRETDLIDPFQFDRPQGRILRRYSDSLVDIDLGSSDKLRPGIAFSIFPSDTIIRGMQPRNRAFRDAEGKVVYRPVPKGKLEVVDVIGPNIAQCRIVDEDNAVRDRIIPGDLLYNALWRKGVSEHVALFGVFDLDGDGRDDMQALIAGLRRVGVVVDAYYDFNKPNKEDPSKPGGWVGEITSLTNFGVEGYYPTVTAADGNRGGKMEILGGISRAKAAVKEKGIMILKPRDFFPRIGYNAKVEVSQDAINAAATSLSRAANAKPAGEGAADPAKPPEEKK